MLEEKMGKYDQGIKGIGLNIHYQNLKKETKTLQI